MKGLFYMLHNLTPVISGIESLTESVWKNGIDRGLFYFPFLLLV